MIRRRVAGLAISALMLGGIGVYGAGTAFAATPTPSPSSTPSQGSGHPDIDRDAMIRHCTDQLPADQRAKAREQMEKMMSTMDGDSMMGGMMQDGSGGMH